SGGTGGTGGSGHHIRHYNENLPHFMADHYLSDMIKDLGDDLRAKLKNKELFTKFKKKLKRVTYNEHSEQPSHLPENYKLYVKPTQEVKYLKSQCTGRKRALLIGINYFHTQYELKGCINDVKNIKKFLIDYCNFKDGHGGQRVDLDGDEADGYDETIMPLDFKTNGEIIDDEMHNILVDGLPAGCRLTVVFDSCHSGTVLDLPYVYSTHGKVKESKLSSSFEDKRIRRKNLETKSSPADVIMFSGCKDEQTSADASENGAATGAMSHALITTLKHDSTQTYQSLLNNIRDFLRDRYSQKPQLSASHPMDMNE
ncbi:14733_t:CDS:2, partial [Gigaspora rosea]